MYTHTRHTHANVEYSLSRAAAAIGTCGGRARSWSSGKTISRGLSFTEGDGREGRSVDPSSGTVLRIWKSAETPLSVTVSRRLGPLRQHRRSSRWLVDVVVFFRLAVDIRSAKSWPPRVPCFPVRFPHVFPMSSSDDWNGKIFFVRRWETVIEFKREVFVWKIRGNVSARRPPWLLQDDEEEIRRKFVAILHCTLPVSTSVAMILRTCLCLNFLVVGFNGYLQSLYSIQMMINL